MADLDTQELLYVAGIALFLNILVFAVTILMISWCQPRGSDLDLESADHDNDNNDTNVPLLGEYGKRSRLLDLIPKIKFLEVVSGRKTTSSSSLGEQRRGNGCCICLGDEFDDEELCKVLPECNHVFHSDCIDQWLEKKQSCPVCRKIFVLVHQQPNKGLN